MELYFNAGDKIKYDYNTFRHFVNRNVFTNKASRNSVGILKMLTMDEDIQQSLLDNSKGASLLKKVMLSKKTKEILVKDTVSYASLDSDVLNKILENTLVEPKFKEYENILEKADYLINQSIDQGTIDNDLNKIQKKLENELK